MLHVIGTSIAWFTLGYVLPVVAQESPADVRAQGCAGNDT
jgi:hypothetical protein